MSVTRLSLTGDSPSLAPSPTDVPPYVLLLFLQVAAAVVAADLLGFPVAGANLGRTAEFTSKVEPPRTLLLLMRLIRICLNIILENKLVNIKRFTIAVAKILKEAENEGVNNLCIVIE